MKTNTINVIKKSLFLAFILIAITIVISIVVRYDVEGEKELPYNIEKIQITSHIDAKDSGNQTENIWDVNLKEDNNIFIYLKKKDETVEDTIKEVRINNFKILENPNIGEVKIYRPTGDLGSDLYKLSEQNYLNSEITYTGAKVDTLKNLEIRNEGGIMGFRVSLENLGNFTSNEGVTYDGKLLSDIGLTNDDIKFKLAFDLNIVLNNDINYIGNIKLDIPIGDIINETEPLEEITDFSGVVFKREK